MKTLIEFVAEYENETISDATTYVNSTMDAIKAMPYHYGDCTKENITCNMCMAEELLNKYGEYTRKERDALKRRAYK